MKNNEPNKEFLYRRSKKNERKKRKRKEKKLQILKYEISLKQRRKKLREYAEVIAPENLTLQFGYSSEVLSFIEKLKSLGDTETEINIRLNKVTELGEGAVSMLLSVMNELTRKGVILFGEKPDHKPSRNRLEQSGFFKYMRGEVAPENMNSKNIIIHTGDINTSQQQLAPEMLKAMETVWGTKGRCPELFGGIGEMLRNSCDHAFQNGHKIMWHLGVSHNDREKTVKFSFVDNGIGIIKRYVQKSIWTQIKTHFKDNADVLKNAYEEGIESRTGLPWRGKGLPSIYELYTNKIITNLVVITNNVYLDFDRARFEEINIPFSGTYYFWKVNSSCVKHCFI